MAVLVMGANLLADHQNNLEQNRYYRAEGSVEFNIGTSPYGGEYSPRHVFAIWVTDENDQFVRTLVRRAWQEIEDLVKWNNMTGGNFQNALVTGATLNAHTSHNLTWDCTDRYLQPLPDGIYRIYVEFNENDAPPSGPWTMIEFNKGNESVTLNPAGSNFFNNIELIYTPVNLPDPAIEITSPADNSIIENLPFLVTFEVTGFDPSAGDGYIGLYYNESFIEMFDSVTPIEITNFPEGSTDLTLMLLDTNGEPLIPEISDTVTLNWNPIGTGDELQKVAISLQNYPNPSNMSGAGRSPATVISFNIEQNIQDKLLEIVIYNVRGQILKTLPVTPSQNQQFSVMWDGRDQSSQSVGSGVYLYQLQIDGEPVAIRKMMFIK
jgi:hypothetical protein